jgi:hypothetical protein
LTTEAHKGFIEERIGRINHKGRIGRREEKSLRSELGVLGALAGVNFRDRRKFTELAAKNARNAKS